jgi:hypothetical protein
MIERKKNAFALSSVLVGVVMLSTIGALLTGCDSSPSASKSRPSAFFITDVQFTGFSFVASFTNQSRDSKGNPAGSSTVLDFLWTFQGKSSSTSVTPLDREWSLTELNLTAGIVGAATRITSLTVTENNDPEKRAEWSETLVFEIAEEGMVTASVFKGEFNNVREIHGDPLMVFQWR